MMRARIVILGLIYFLLLNSFFFAEKKRDINSWQELFTEPFERVLIILKDKDNPNDGIILRFTDHYRHMVCLNTGTIKKELKKLGYKIEDIKVIIHNHFRKCKFSRADLRQYWMLKSCGFDGRFLLYCKRTNKTYDIEGKTR